MGEGEVQMSVPYKGRKKLEALADLILQLREKVGSQVFVVNLCGPSAVSKSNVIIRLMRILRRKGISSAHIQTDGFLYPPEVMRELMGKDPREWNGFPEAYDYVGLWYAVRSLKSGKGVVVPVYEHLRHERSEQIRRIKPRQVIFLEGLHPLANAAYPSGPLKLLINLRIYMGQPEGSEGEEFLLRSRIERELRRERRAKELYGISRSEEEIRRIYEVRERRLYRDVVFEMRDQSHISLTINFDYSIRSVALREPRGLKEVEDVGAFVAAFGA